jgi:hypothetical protein
MSESLGYKVLSDDFINQLFECTNFGEAINNCVEMKRKQIAKTLQNQVDGYWSGHTAYHIVVNAGFLKDGKRSTHKELTALGVAFLQEQAHATLN